MRKPFAPLLLLVVFGFLASCTSPLIDAARQGDVKALGDILQRGTDVNESDGNGGYIRQYGTDGGILLVAGTALHHAAYSCRLGAMKLLIDKGADVNKMTGSSPLYFASASGCNEGVKLLLEKGADINAKGRWGSPLSVAAVMGNGSTAKLLVERGADVDDAIGYLRSEDRKKFTLGAQLIETISGKDAAQRKIASVPAMPLPEPFTEVSETIKSDVDEILPMVSKHRNNAYAVVIGIENYRSLPKSDYSRSDATLVKSYIKSLGFQERNIDFIVDERAAKTDIEKSLEAWLPNRVKKDSSVFIYYSGHGSPDPSSGEAYIVPYDGDPNYLKVTGYSLNRLYHSLGKLGAREVVVILDSCFSGAGGRSVLAQGARPLVMMAETATLSSNMAVMTATQGNQISTSSREKGHGIFTYYFLKAIKDGKKSIAEIYEYLKPQVEDEAKLLNVQQSPSLNPAPEKLMGRFNLRR